MGQFCKAPKPGEEILILLPGWDRANWRRISDLLQGLSFHFEICPGINLSCLDINVTEEISNHVERDSALQHVHPFRVSKSMWTHCPIQAWNFALRFGCASETGESSGMKGVHHVNYPFSM